MSGKDNTQDASRRSHIILPEDMIEKESYIFCGYIEENKTENIKNFLSVNKYENIDPKILIMKQYSI